MKKKHNYKFMKKAAASVAATFIVGVSLSQTAFGQDITEKIIKSISIGSGNIKAVQTEKVEIDSYNLPNELKGKVFDKDGNSLDIISKDYRGNFYTADGEEIHDMIGGKITTVKEYESSFDILEVKNVNDLNKYTAFDVKLPSYLPEGYKFDRAEFTQEKNEEVKDSKYISIFFVNEKGKEIYMQQRLSDKETGYEMGTDGKLEEVKVNGVDAVIMDGRTIDWEYNKVLYGISGKGKVKKDELVKIAESIK